MDGVLRLPSTRQGQLGFQAGAEQIDVVMLVMNESGVQKLAEEQGQSRRGCVDCAGPVRRQGQVSTDVSLTAEILAYSRAKGLFAGINLSGGVLRPDEDANTNVYGSHASPSTILASRSISAPTQATPFLEALGVAAKYRRQRRTQSKLSERHRPMSYQPPIPICGRRSSPCSRRIDEYSPIRVRRRSERVARQPGTNVRDGLVSRERLGQLRSQLDALLASLNAKGAIEKFTSSFRLTALQHHGLRAVVFEHHRSALLIREIFVATDILPSPSP